ncbi:serine hydroxymethyltransferase 2, mitochondrial-like [Solanum tuberosum]|uniref:Serine hydroxymethyltransferase n=1 Tax=Solanum tuberosum TaxID=4113 RepID=M1CD88_SOLTU|nr:PREDICTED: serine hydroxymethyltransferase 2, mitochondrial-like [Solanum tuberosum]
MWIKQRNSLFEDIGSNSVDIIELEKARQWNGHKLIPSENFTSLSVMLVVRSILPIIFNERCRGTRYYGGDKYIDMTAKLCEENVLEVFKIDPATWRINVQLLTRSLINFQVSIALLESHEKCATFFRPKLIVAIASVYARLCDYACIHKIGNTQLEIIFLVDMAHINGLAVAKVIFPFKYAIPVACATQFMGGQVYVFIVLDKSLFA